jgi:transcriptional regulator with XRE-family HTH domain
VTDPATLPRPRQPWTTILDGGQLRQLRRQAALSQEQLADRAGLSPATVTRLERQHHAPCRGRTLARLAAALHTEPAALSPSAPG